MVQPRNTAAAMSKPELNVKSGAANEPAQVGAGGNGEDMDAATKEALREELIKQHYKVDCSKGMHLMKIANYPSKSYGRTFAVESHIVVNEEDKKPIRVGAIVVNGAAVESKGKITEWKVLRQYPSYMNALLTSLNESKPNSVHAFQATLRYANDFVLAVIAPPSITRYVDGSLPEGVVQDESLQYKILVQQNKHHEGPTSEKENLVKRWFKRFTWKSVSEKVSEAERKSSDGKKSDRYVTMPGNGDSHVPIQASAPRLDDEPYGVHYTISQKTRTRRSAIPPPTYVAGSKRPSEGIQEAIQTYGIPAILAIGSAGAAIGGTIWLSKSPRMKSYIGL